MKPVNVNKHIIVLVITVLIFSLGIMVGNFLTERRVVTLGRIGEDLRLQSMSAELEFELLSEDPCRARTGSFFNELYDLSERLDFMERELGNEHPEVLNLKNFYSLLQIRHWLFSRSAQDECGFNDTTIMYFYSNEGDCDVCQEQGFVLTYIKQLYPVKVYSFDINVHNTAVDAVRELYDIQAAPTLLIDDEIFDGYMSASELKQILNRKYVVLDDLANETLPAIDSATLSVEGIGELGLVN